MLRPEGFRAGRSVERLDRHVTNQSDPGPVDPARSATLTVVSGLPGTGKTTLAQAFARQLGACYLRIDAVETALARAGVRVTVEGYAVVHELAVSNLVLGTDVVVDAVNAVAEARAGWRVAASRGGAQLVQVETTLPDAAEHRRRVETRTADIPGHEVPSWADVEALAWTLWDDQRDGQRLLIDTTDSGQALGTLMANYPFR